MSKFFSILLSVLLIASHMYLSIGTHFCGGEAVNTKLVLGKTQLDCGMDAMDEGCQHPEDSGQTGDRLEKAPCCENEYQTLDSTDDFIKEFNVATLNFDFTASFFYVLLTLDLQPELKPILYAAYSPPLFEKDIQVLFQTFLN
jgi:hypothetical protein